MNVVGLARAGIRSLWFIVIPALLAGIVLRYLVPEPGATDGHGLPAILAAAGSKYPVPFAFFLFVLFTVLARYWRFHLPAGRYLSSLPLPLALRTPRDGLYEYEGAAALLRRGARRRATVAAVWVVAAGGTALFTRVSLFESYRVLGSSMLPTLEGGDRIGASKVAYGFRVPGTVRRAAALPRRGDVIVFQRDAEAGGGESGHLVKRVIGLPGDRIAMQGGIPVINGEPVPNCDAGSYLYVEHDYAAYARLLVEFLDGRPHLAIQTPLSQPFDETYVVKAGEVFVLGDNRSNSLDSRSWNGGRGGGVPLASIDGEARLVLAGTKRNGEVDASELLRPLGLTLNLDGIDTHELEEGITRCLNGQTQQKNAAR